MQLSYEACCRKREGVQSKSGLFDIDDPGLQSSFSSSSDSSKNYSVATGKDSPPQGTVWQLIKYLDIAHTAFSFFWITLSSCSSNCCHVLMVLSRAQGRPKTYVFFSCSTTSLSYLYRCFNICTESTFCPDFQSCVQTIGNKLFLTIVVMQRFCSKVTSQMQQKLSAFSNVRGI